MLEKELRFPQYSKMPQALIGVAVKYRHRNFASKDINHHREHSEDEIFGDVICVNLFNMFFPKYSVQFVSNHEITVSIVKYMK